MATGAAYFYVARVPARCTHCLTEGTPLAEWRCTYAQANGYVITIMHVRLCAACVGAVSNGDPLLPPGGDLPPPPSGLWSPPLTIPERLRRATNWVRGWEWR